MHAHAHTHTGAHAPPPAPSGLVSLGSVESEVTQLSLALSREPSGEENPLAGWPHHLPPEECRQHAVASGSTLGLSHVTREGKMKPRGVRDVSGPQNSKFWDQDSVWVSCTRPWLLVPMAVWPPGSSLCCGALSLCRTLTNWTRRATKM